MRNDEWKDSSRIKFITHHSAFIISSMRVFHSQGIKDEAQVGAARRSVHRYASRLGRKWVAAPRGEKEGVRAARRLSKRVGAWSRPCPGEETNGDAYFIGEHDGETLIAVVDGLGHGRGAQEAAQAALDTLESWRGEALDEVVRAAHDALRATRGAVMGAV